MSKGPDYANMMVYTQNSSIRKAVEASICIFQIQSKDFFFIIYIILHRKSRNDMNFYSLSYPRERAPCPNQIIRIIPMITRLILLIELINKLRYTVCSVVQLSL